MARASDPSSTIESTSGGRGARRCGGLSLALTTAVLAGLVTTGRALAQPGASADTAALYVGGRVFHDYCASCHGSDARGSLYAPDLKSLIEGMERRDFMAILANGYRGVDGASPPPWGTNRDVDRYASELWEYLVRGQ